LANKSFYCGYLSFDLTSILLTRFPLSAIIFKTLNSLLIAANKILIIPAEKLGSVFHLGRE